jgi:hypothetical protein
VNELEGVGVLDRVAARRLAARAMMATVDCDGDEATASQPLEEGQLGLHVATGAIYGDNSRSSSDGRRGLQEDARHALAGLGGVTEGDLNQSFRGNQLAGLGGQGNTRPVEKLEELVRESAAMSAAEG